jgi:hypothetical protein
MSQPPQPTPEFWKLDLSRLTLAGWVLMLMAIATVLGVAALVLALVTKSGLAGNPPNNRSSRFVGGVAAVIGIAAGASVFALGQAGPSRLGWKVLGS